MTTNTRFEVSGDDLFGSGEPMTAGEINEYLLFAKKELGLYGWDLSVEDRGDVVRVSAEFIGDADDDDTNPRAFQHWHEASAPLTWWSDFPAVTEEMITAAEADKLFGLNTGTVRRVCNRTPDVLNARKSGSTWLVSVPACEKRWKRAPRVGDRVRVLEHTAYRDLVNGAIVSPMIEYTVKSYTSTVESILQDEMEDEHGNTVIEVSYILKDGNEYPREYLEVIK